jgi:hypothetical protein
MPIPEQVKERWAEAERSYEQMRKKREKKRQEAAQKEAENEARRKKKAEQQRLEAAKAAASKPSPPPPPPPPPNLSRRKEMLSRMGLSVDNPIEIKKTWKRLALQYHPDKCGSDTKFKSILEAYEFLMQ